MSSEEAQKVADPPTQEEKKESDAQQNEQENNESEDGSEVSKIVEAQTIHEEDVVESETTGESGGDEGNAAEAEEAAEEEEKPRKLTLDDIKTAPMDFRFPTTNQAKHCFTRYVEYHKCIRAKGEDNPDCDKYARYYRSLCPGEWIDKWNEQRENGTFPGPLQEAKFHMPWIEFIPAAYDARFQGVKNKGDVSIIHDDSIHCTSRKGAMDVVLSFCVDNSPVSLCKRRMYSKAGT